MGPLNNPLARVGLLVAALCLAAGLARAHGPARIPVIFHVAERDGQPVAPAAFIAEQLAAANGIFGPLGIELVEKERVPLAGHHAELITRADVPTAVVLSETVELASRFSTDDSGRFVNGLLAKIATEVRGEPRSG